MTDIGAALTLFFLSVLGVWFLFYIAKENFNNEALERILNFGEIIFTGTGDAEIIFTYVTNPAKIKREVEQ